MDTQLGTVLTATIIVVIYGFGIAWLVGAIKDIFIPDTKQYIKEYQERDKYTNEDLR